MSCFLMSSNEDGGKAYDCRPHWDTSTKNALFFAHAPKIVDYFIPLFG